MTSPTRTGSTIASKHLTNTEHTALRYIITHEGVSRSELADALHVSMPTIASGLKRLSELRYIVQTKGTHSSTGGRRSDGYAFAYSRCICIGVLVRAGTVHLIATNLRGEAFSRTAIDLEAHDTHDFYIGLARAIEHFIQTSHIDTRHLRGIGVTVSSRAAIDDASESKLRTTIESHLSYPVRIMREPLALAAAETLYAPHISDAVCLYLNSEVSSTFITDHRYVKNASFIEHMTLYPGEIAQLDTLSTPVKPSEVTPSSPALQCPCGQKGCAQLYCSATALIHGVCGFSGNVPEFFTHIRDNDYAYTRAFDSYMDSLALLIHNIRMVRQVPVIVGGQVARYFDSSDIADLISRVRTRAPKMLLAAQSRRSDSDLAHGTSPLPPVIKSTGGVDQAIIGAAYVLGQDYLDSLLQ